MKNGKVIVPKMQYCSKCTYPAVSATPITFDKNGICSGCRVHMQQETIDWDERRALFETDIVEQYKGTNGANYDCLIPVSGGKDSYWQIHLIKVVYGMRPLLVTYGENNHTAVGMRNIQRMRDTFSCDHIHFTPSISLLKKMNKIGLVKMGDPDMQAHIGIMTYPIAVAAKYEIPLIIWGEHGFMNLGGMHSYSDMVEWTAKFRREHAQHGWDWDDFVDEGEGISERDLLWAKYPSDDVIEKLDMRGIYISNYFGWRQDEHTALMVKKYGFELNDMPFDRTYARDSNLNNIHDNGVHDYMKFVKWGYGRVTDHVSRDIRNGNMTREEGISLIKQYEDVVPGDLTRWLEYVGMDRTTFNKTADTFRDPRVWVKNEYGQWIKDNIWNHN